MQFRTLKRASLGKMTKPPFRIRNRYLFVADLGMLALTPALALILRLETLDVRIYLAPLAGFTAFTLLAKLAVFYTIDLYRRYWRYASMTEWFTIGVASGGIALFDFVLLAGWRALQPGTPLSSLPLTVPLLDGILTLLLVTGLRLGVRGVEGRLNPRHLSRKFVHHRVLIAGAGAAGAMIVRELQTSAQVDQEPVGFVDDDLAMRGMVIRGLPVLGTRQDLPRLIREFKVNEVIIALPTVPGKTIREIVRICEQAGATACIVPGFSDILSGRVDVSQIRKVEIEDLLRREPIATNVSKIGEMLRGRRVLVTGAGGSIGSELCRQIVRYGPHQLILLGHGENSLFQLDAELRRLVPGGCAPELKIVVADVRARQRLEGVFRTLRPEIVFHTAAHKHVPMMEENVEDAVTNNVLGTLNVVQIAADHEVQRFVMISSDKAVNPTSVMGVTKRASELAVMAVARRLQRPYVVVRFGNVLGSRNSVVPIFRQQISEGGPVTITDPEMKRYFMTIPEAVQLVLQAATLGPQGQVFVLDMGEPVRILDLARDLIELSGYQVGRDIDIVFTGRRPGEKLFEELFLSQEDYQRTTHPQIFGARRAADALPPSLESFDLQIEALISAALHSQSAEIYRWLKQLVPEYQPGFPVDSNPTTQDEVQLQARGDLALNEKPAG